MDSHKVAGDVYYGDAARNYEERRRLQPYWDAEDTYVRGALAALPRGLSVLDVAMGTGRFFPFYREMGHSIHGIDSSADMISEAFRLRPEVMRGSNCQVALANELPFDDASFDLVLSFRFLSWIVSAATAYECLAEISRVAKRYVIVELCTNSGVNSREVEMAETLWNRLTVADTCSLLSRFNLRVFSVAPIIDLFDHPGTCGFLCEKIK
jgi:ubiquinone/menaquinone biosynthesis C-methylase UbiE